MRRALLSMRWWLALVFAVIVASTALIVAQLMTQRSEDAFRDRAQELAAGTVLSAAARLEPQDDRAALRSTTARIAREMGIGIFLYDASGRLLTARRSHGVDVDEIGPRKQIVIPPLQGDRVVARTDGGRRIVVALPLQNVGPAAVLVGVASRPDLIAAGRIVHGNMIGAVLLAIGFGALVGLIVAFVITFRLRRIAQTAVAIGAGDFERQSRSRFPDELGQLAEAIDRMRVQLSGSFKSLEVERLRLARLLEQLQEGVLAVDTDLRIVYANRRARSQLHATSLEEGDPLPDPWPEFSLRDVAGRLFERQATVLYERVSLDDGARTYALAGVPARAGVAVLVITDVSLQERRERAEREFVANAAHELRTPLSAIAGAAEALEAGAKDDPADLDRFVAIIARQTSRLGGLVRAMLALARAQTGRETLQLEIVQLKPLLAEIGAEASEGGARIKLDCPASLSVVAHPDLLRQAVENLVSNAVKYGGGEVEIDARALKDGLARIEVADSGSGLDIEQRERAFDRFFRAGGRDGEGFGLGLPIVREVVTALGGEVDIESASGQGTRVGIVLPRPVKGDGK